MEEDFIIKADNGHFRLSIQEVFGFPDTTSGFGGYDTKSRIEIISSNYSAIGHLYITTGEIYDFYTQLNNSYQTLRGGAILNNYEGNLDVNISQDGAGHFYLNGTFKEKQLEENELKFELNTDQTYMSQAIQNLKKIADKYGDNKGKGE